MNIRRPRVTSTIFSPRPVADAEPDVLAAAMAACKEALFGDGPPPPPTGPATVRAIVADALARHPGPPPLRQIARESVRRATIPGGARR